jgi:hypothetical protein
MEHKIYARYPLGNPKRKWKQKSFLLSQFSAKAQDMRKALQTCKDAGFNLCEIAWASHEQAEEAARLCDEIGVDVLFQDMSRYGGMQENRKCEVSDLAAVIEEKRDVRHIVGYYIWDEPYHDDEITEARRLTDLCEEIAPHLMPFSVAIPSYNPTYTWQNRRYEEYLEKYASTIEPPMLSLDYYPIGMAEVTEELQCDKSLMWCDLGLLRKLGKKYDMPIWFYYQGQNLNKAERFTFPMIRCMMYAGVLYGAKGLQHYTATGSVITKEGEKDIFFEPQKQIHREFESLGNTLMALDCKRVIHDESVCPESVDFAALHETIKDSAYFSSPLPKRISVSEFEDAYGNGYVLIFNRDYETEQAVTLPLKEAFRIYETSKKDGSQHVIENEASIFSLTLAPGDARLFRFQSSKDAPFSIEYRLCI